MRRGFSAVLAVSVRGIALFGRLWIGGGVSVPLIHVFLKKIRIFLKIVRYIRYMSIDTSHNIIPSNIGGTLNQKSQAVFLRGKNAVVPQNFAEAHGNVLSSMESLSATRYVKVGDTHGKSGFSALGQILSNIGHNIKALFSGNGSAERANLEKSVNDLELFAKKKGISLKGDDIKKLQQLYSAVKSAKEEHVQQDNDWNNIKSGAEAVYNANKDVIEKHTKALKNKIDAYRQKYTNYGTFEEFARNISDLPLGVEAEIAEIKSLYKAYQFLQGNPFEKLALRAFTIVPGDIEAAKALCKDLQVLKDLAKIAPPDASYFNTTIDSRINDLQSSKPNVSSLSLADRLETALQMIFKKANVS